jgi:hypothetical protein
MISYFSREKEKRDKLNIGPTISNYLVLQIALG